MIANIRTSSMSSKIRLSTDLISFTQQRPKNQHGSRSTGHRSTRRSLDLCHFRTYRIIGVWRTKMLPSMLRFWACRLILPSPIGRGEFAVLCVLFVMLKSYGSCDWVARGSDHMRSVLAADASGNREDTLWHGESTHMTKVSRSSIAVMYEFFPKSRRF